MKYLLILLFLFSTQSFAEEPASTCVINCSEAEIKKNTKNQKQEEKREVQLHETFKTEEELDRALNESPRFKNLSPQTKAWIKSRWIESNKKDLEKYFPKKTESSNLNSNENKNSTYTQDKFTNDMIDMLAVGIISGLMWIGLNFLRLLLVDFLYTKKLTLEKEKKYLSKRKSGYLTAFIIGLGTYLIANSGGIIFRYYQSYTANYITIAIISLVIMWMLYQHEVFNSKLKKQINSESTNKNPNITSHLDNTEIIEEDEIDESTLDETQKLEKVENMYKKKLISSSERKKMRSKILGID